MILAKLKEATREQHENLEGIVAVMDRMFELEDYKKLLTKFYRFYSSIEPKVAAIDLTPFGYDAKARLKTPSLERDLKQLGVFDEVKNVAGTWNDLPDIDTPANAFGVCYVMEGATLGGQIITRHLKQHLGLTPENGGSFFNSYGEKVGPMWKEFCTITNDFNEKNGGDEETIQAAKETFDSFAACFTESATAKV